MNLPSEEATTDSIIFAKHVSNIKTCYIQLWAKVMHIKIAFFWREVKLWKWFIGQQAWSGLWPLETTIQAQNPEIRPWMAKIKPMQNLRNGAQFALIQAQNPQISPWMAEIRPSIPEIDPKWPKSHHYLGRYWEQFVYCTFFRCTMSEWLLWTWYRVPVFQPR